MAFAAGRGFRALGEGLQGIGRTVGNIRREEEEEARRLKAETFAQELLFAQQGGGMGPPPEMERTVARAPLSFEAPAFTPPPRQAGVSGDSLLPPPDLSSGPSSMSVSAPDPRYAQVGEGYIERPGVREDRERLARGDRITAAVGPMLGDDVSPEAASGMGSLLAEGINPSALRMPNEGVNWQTVTTRDGRIKQVHPRTGQVRDTGELAPEYSGGGARPVGLPTYDQAYEMLKEQYAQFETNDIGVQEFRGYSIPLQQMHEMATRLASGQPVDLAKSDMDSVLPPPALADKPGFGGWLARMLPGGDPGVQIEHPAVGAPDDMLPPPEPGSGMLRRDPLVRERPAMGAPAAPDPASPAGAGLREISRDEADYLRVVKGMSDEEINRLYKVR